MVTGLRRHSVLQACRALLLFTVAVGAPQQATAQDASPWLIGDALRYEGSPIRSITFEPVRQPIQRGEALAKLPFQVGDLFRESDLRRAIQALYATGRYRQIAVDAAPESEGVALRFLTAPAYFVGHVSIAGLDGPPNRGQLFGVAKLRLGRAYTDDDKTGAIAAMRDLLRANGFYNPSISVQTEPDQQTQQIGLDFSIRPGKRAHFREAMITGITPSEAAQLRPVTHWKRLYGVLGETRFSWQLVTDSRQLNGVENIRTYYEKHDHLEAKVKLVDRRYDQATNSVEPVIQIDKGDRVTVRIEGARLSNARLRQLLPMFQERTIDPDLLQEGEQNIERAFQGQGYFGVEVTHSVEVNSAAHATTITYTVSQGHRHRFVYLQIRGNHYFSENTLRERMSIAPAEFPRFPRGRFSEASLRDDSATIERLYQANGFNNVKVQTQILDNYGEQRDDLGVLIEIREGEQSIVDTLAIEGTSGADDAVLRRIIASTPNQPFSSANVARDREAVLEYFYGQGYLNATFDYDLQLAAAPDRVQLRYVVNAGVRRYVRDILVSGLQTTRDNLVLKRISLQKGNPISRTDEIESQRKLYDLGIFARVSTALQNPEGNEDKKDVLFDIDEAKHYSLNVGVGAQIARIGGGVTTLDNPAGTTGFAPRLAVGLTRENFRGLGESLGMQTAISTIEQRAALTWFIPQFVSNPNLNLTTVVSIDNSNDIRTFTANRREASVQLGQRLSRAYTLQYRLVFRNVTLQNLKIDQLLVPLLSQPESIGLAEASLIEDKRDDPTDAHHGTYTTLDVSYAPSFLGSQTQFGRVLFRNSTYYQLRRDLVLARSTQLGAIERTGGRPNIPLAERLYSGGSTSIRAFPDFQAGPRDIVTGFPVGGSALFINNTELRFPLIGDNVGGVLFHDAGNVYSNPQSFSLRFRQANLQDFNYLVQDVGVGIRYRTPIGPIRADFSFSPDAPRFFGLRGTLQQYLDGTAASTVQKINAFQFHISLGQAF